MAIDDGVLISAARSAHRAVPCEALPLGTKECRNAGSEEQLLKEIRELYKGTVVAAHDLDVY